MNPRPPPDIIIIGSGVSGLIIALSLPRHFNILILTKTQTISGASPWAQGGIAAVVDSQDSLQSHLDNTLNAGGYLNSVTASQHIIKQGPDIIQRLIQWGVPFDQDGQRIHLYKEGGHDHRRIAHIGDSSGKAIMHTLQQQVLNQPNIQILEHHMVIDLITDPISCLGVRCLNTTTQTLQHYYAQHTVLATGGASDLYSHSTNTGLCTGDGIALAHRAGATIQSMEFIQFHPTCLYHSSTQAFLISEALRGEGAVLRSLNQQRFMHHYDSREELAPRDIVSRAILTEMKQHHLDHVYCDISHRPNAQIIQQFPSIYQTCLSHGIDITKTPIPVTPAAHYTCGGVTVDVQGKTSIHRLYAVGETACTGLHGANRLASNSLLECIAVSLNAAESIAHHPNISIDTSDAAIHNQQTQPPLSLTKIKDTQQTVQHIMWQHVGIYRDTQGLLTANQQLQTLKKNFDAITKTQAIDQRTQETHNMLDTALLITHQAQQRTHNIGCHFNTDYAT